MKTKRFLKSTLFVLLAGVVLVSCNDDEIPFEVYTDVLVINKKVDNVVKKAPAYYAYGNKSLKSASVALPGNSDTISLAAHPGSTYTFIKEPAAADFKDVPPAEGNYKFKVTAGSGEALEMTDAFDYTGLPLPQITKDTFSGSPSSLLVEWAAVTGADGYFVKMLDTDEKLIFSGYVVSSTTLKYIVSGSTTSGSWTEVPDEGEPYILQVNAVVYDADATSSNREYNVSEVSTGEKEIVWGEN
jgi:hypothetical protein